MKYFIFIIVFIVTFYPSLSEDRKWYYIDSVEIDGRLDRINQSIIVVDSLNNKYFIEGFLPGGLGRVIKYDNIKFTKLKIDDEYSPIYSSPIHYPQIDIDNSLWWATFISSPKLLEENFLIHYNNNIMTKYSIDSLFVDFGISTNKSKSTSAFEICIDYNGIKHFLTAYGIVSFDNKTFSIDTTFSALEDSIEANKKFVVSKKLFLSFNNNLLYIRGITDYKTDSTNFEIFEKINDTWIHLKSIKIFDQKTYFKVDRTGKNLFLVHGDRDWIILLKIYDIEKNEWYYYQFPSYHSHTGLTQTADFDSRNHFWYHETAAQNKYIFIFDGVNISTVDYPNIPKLLYAIVSMKFDKADNLWCSSNSDSAIFVYAKEKPLFVRNKNIDENLLLSISPNPVTEKLTLKNIPENATEFEIYDQFGNRQISGLISGQIDVSLLPEGVYFIKLNNSMRPLKFLKI